jgi:hypothetical protein
MDDIKWCLPCALDRNKRQSTIQHVTQGGRRLGHMYTYGSCPWHHQGIKEDGYSRQDMIGLLGPSFAMGRRQFEAKYGNERNVLVPLQTWCFGRGEIRNHELITQWHHLRRMN